jgi:predicted alpha/beta hydrolase
MWFHLMYPSYLPIAGGSTGNLATGFELLQIIEYRVVGGDEKGSLKSETVKYGREYQGTQTREWLRWQRPAAYTKDRPVLSSQREPHENKTVTVNQ